MNPVVQALVGCLGIVVEMYGHDQSVVQSHLLPLMELAEVRVPAEYVADSCAVDSLPEVQKWLIEKTQEKFYARTTGERWVQSVPEWIERNEDQAMAHFVGLGLTNKTYAKEQNFECAAIFGSTTTHVQKAMTDFAERLEVGEVNIAQVFLLTGERYADSRVDGGEKYVAEIASKYGTTPDKVTEAMLMEDLYRSLAIKFPHLAKLPATTIDTPRGSRKRPNTVDTILQFIDTIPADACPTVLFVSRAPYTLPQSEDTRRVMLEKSPGRRFEVVGGAVSVAEAPSKARAAYHMSMALAGSFYGGRERVSDQIRAQYLMCPAYEQPLCGA